MDDETIKKYAYVIISQYRIKTIKSLSGDVKIPSKIAKESGIRINHVSNVLSDLKTEGIAECVNEEAKKGRMYRLTDLGEEIARNLD